MDNLLHYNLLYTLDARKFGNTIFDTEHKDLRNLSVRLILSI